MECNWALFLFSFVRLHADSRYALVSNSSRIAGEPKGYNFWFPHSLRRKGLSHWYYTFSILRPPTFWIRRFLSAYPFCDFILHFHGRKGGILDGYHRTEFEYQDAHLMEFACIFANTPSRHALERTKIPGKGLELFHSGFWDFGMDGPSGLLYFECRNGI